MQISNEMTVCYKLLAEQYLIKKYALDKLDERFSQCSADFKPHGEEKPGNNLKYIFLLNTPKLERLTEEQQAVIAEIIDTGDTATDIVEYIESTFRTALAGTVKPGVFYEYYEDVNGEGILPGKAVVFRFADKAEVEKIEDAESEKEMKKTEVFASVKHQFEELVSKRYPDDIVYLVRF